MKIGMILDTAFPPDSRVENEAFSLIQAGHTVFLFCLNYNHQINQEKINGIKIYRYPASKLLYKLSALAYTFCLYHFLTAKRIRKFIKKVDPDIIHVHDMGIAPAGFKEGRKAKLPIILDLHENRPIIMKEYVHLKKFPGKWLISPKRWNKAQNNLAKSADQLIVVAEEARTVLSQESGVDQTKIHVVPNTIHDQLYLSYPINPEIIQRFAGGFNLLYMGDTGLRRGTDTAIQAVALLKLLIPDIRLIFVGKNTEDAILRKMVEEFDVKENVIFEGWKDVTLFPSYGKVADICLSPLKRNLHHDTTFANKIFQYMAGEKPIIVSDCPAQARVIQTTEAGLVHMAENPADLADKILTLYQDPELRFQMGQNGGKAVKNKWNWSKTSKELIELYDILGKKSNASN